MKIEQRKFSTETGWSPESNRTLAASVQLVFAFGATAVLKNTKLLEEIKKEYPKAHILGCSTAGEIFGTQVLRDSLVTTAICFEDTQIEGVQSVIKRMEDSFHVGEKIAKALPTENLKHVLVFSDGLMVNGSELVRGLVSQLPGNVTITGGLAADGASFKETLVFYDNILAKNSVIALGLYGDRLRVSFGSMGGWDSFGPERLITRSKGNVLYEFDGQSALELYKKYLGDHAKDLPAAGVLFPICVRANKNEEGVVRTFLSVNEKEQTLTFAGDVPEGTYARLMKTNFDHLIDGAIGAAKICVKKVEAPAQLAILVSCVGRKMVLKQRTEEEVEVVQQVLGQQAVLTGFYSYGEISPFAAGEKCELHNQTMTITTLSEA